MVRRAANTTAADFGCQDLIFNFAKKYLPPASIISLGISSDPIDGRTCDNRLLGPLQVATQRILVLLQTYLGAK